MADKYPRMVDDYRVESIGDKRPSEGLFVLPAPSKDMRQLMQGVGQQMQQL